MNTAKFNGLRVYEYLEGLSQIIRYSNALSP